jgi:hypothetical protein
MRDKDEELAAMLVGRHVVIGGNRKGGNKDLVVGYTVVPSIHGPKYLSSVSLTFDNGEKISMPLLSVRGYEVELP